MSRDSPLFRAPLLNVTLETVIGPGSSPVGRSDDSSTASVLWTTATEPATLTLRHCIPISPHPPSLNWA